jgi:hypothetical protein
MTDINGEWLGYYTFDEDYGDWGKERRVPFRLVVGKAINDFVGRIFEEVDYGGMIMAVSMMKFISKGGKTETK